MTGKNIRNRVHGAGKSTEVAVGATGVIPYSDANLATYTHNLGAARPSVQSTAPAREVGRGTMMIPFDGWLGTRLQPGLEEASAAGPGLELISLSTFTSRETGGGVPPGQAARLPWTWESAFCFVFLKRRVGCCGEEREEPPV